MTLPELESHLWAAANILRGSPVDRTALCNAMRGVEALNQKVMEEGGWLA